MRGVIDVGELRPSCRIAPRRDNLRHRSGISPVCRNTLISRFGWSSLDDHSEGFIPGLSELQFQLDLRRLSLGSLQDGLIESTTLSCLDCFVALALALLTSRPTSLSFRLTKSPQPGNRTDRLPKVSVQSKSAQTSNYTICPNPLFLRTLQYLTIAPSQKP